VSKRVPWFPSIARTPIGPRSDGRPFPQGAAGVSFWHNGRGAIWQGIRQLGLGPGDRVLAPAYSCGSELDPLVKAGLDLAFYRIREDLTPDRDHLAELLTAPAKALYVTHYFGLPQPIEALRAFARDNGILLIEDAAHGLYSRDEAGRPLGSLGDMAVFSFRKTLPLPDGGALVLSGRVAPNGPSGHRPGPLAIAGRTYEILGYAALERSPRAARLAKRWAADPLVEGLKHALAVAGSSTAKASFGPFDRLNPDRADWRMSSLSRYLLRRVDADEVARRRRRNFRLLGSLVSDGARARPLLSRWPEGACPSCFPLRVEDSAGLSAALQDQGVEARRFWPKTHEVVPIADFPFARALQREIVAVPIHQDLVKADIERIANLIEDWSRR